MNLFLLMTIKMTAMKKIILIPFVFVLFFILPAIGQNDTTINQLDVSDTLDNDFGLFTNDEILNLSFRFDMTAYQRKKPKEEYMKAILTYHLNDKDSINKEIKLKSRGEMRNGYCSFPPIRLNFKKAGFEKEDVKEIEKLKLVTHCKYGNEEYLFKEYLIYKLFNVLTDTSFRVRLLKVEYIDTNPKKRKNKTINTYAFFIEPIEVLAKRINAVEVTSVNLGQKNIYPQLMDRLAIFNYMIGNTDWSVPNQHNCKILTSLSYNPAALGIIVPYDFDYSGLVESVRERKFVGICRPEETFIKDLEEFSAKKEEFYKVINDFPLLKEKEREKMTNYLDGFFEGIDSRHSIVYSLRKECNDF
jgi:hypothetical protein